MTIPLLRGNWIDFLIIAFVLLTIWEAHKRGFIVGVFDFLGFALSFGFALKYYSIASNLLSGNFSFPKGISDTAGFFIVAFVAEILFSYIFSYIVSILPRRITSSRINALFGFFPPIATALLTVTFILTLALSLPIRGSIKATIIDAKIGGVLVSQTQKLERSFARVFGDAALETLNFLTVAPDSKSSDRVDLNFTQSSHTVDREAEKKMLEMVNQERTIRGLAPLESYGLLQDLSRAYAADMFERGYFSHYNPENQSPFDRMEEFSITYLSAGENLALAPAVLVAHKGLMESPGHRANILSKDFGRVGIGVVDGGIYGKMFVQEFTD